MNLQWVLNNLPREFCQKLVEPTVVWSLSGYKEPKLAQIQFIILRVKHFNAALCSRCKILASEVQACIESKISM